MVQTSNLRLYLPGHVKVNCHKQIQSWESLWEPEKKCKGVHVNIVKIFFSYNENLELSMVDYCVSLFCEVAQFIFLTSMFV